MRHLFALPLYAAGAILFSFAADAADFEVHMKNRDSNGQLMAFEPAFLQIQPGDTVKFIPTDMAHNSETIPHMLPDGAEPFKGELSKEITVNFKTPGIYGFRCSPHYSMGMLGLIKVGDSTANLEAAQAMKLPPPAMKRIAPLFELAGQPAAK